MAGYKDYGDPTAGATVFVGIIGVLIFALVVIYLEALYYSSEAQQTAEKVIDVPILAAERNRMEQQEKLHRYDYDHAYNENQGRVSIPIDDAVEKLLREWPERRSNDETAGAGNAAERNLAAAGAENRDEVNE